MTTGLMTMLMKTLSLFPTAYLLRLSYKLCCLEYLLCAFALSAARFRRAVLNIVFLNSKMYRIVMPDSFLGHPDPSMSFLCYILFTGYLLNRGTNTNCLWFTLRLFLIKLPYTFQNFFTFTPLLQTPECSEYHSSPQSLVGSALSFTRLKLS